MKKQKQKFLDIAAKNKQKSEIDFLNTSNSSSFKSTLFSKGKKTDRFFTEDSRLYITPREQEQLRQKIKLDREIKKWDSVSSRIVNDFVYHKPSQSKILLELLENRYAILNESLENQKQNFLRHFSVVRLWNLSIVGSILFGMVTMTFIYRYLGQGAAADQIAQPQAIQQVSQDQGKVLGSETEVDAENLTKQIIEIQQANDQQALEKEIRNMVKGTPIEKMVPYIAKQDRTVAAFIVGIAKKESGWGVHHPVLNGQDCYNYWGYREQRKLMGSGGHTCFNSPQDAVQTVAKRLNTLVNDDGKDTPAKMVLWKCGTACAKDAGAKKWVSDVDTIFQQLNND